MKKKNKVITPKIAILYHLRKAREIARKHLKSSLTARYTPGTNKKGAASAHGQGTPKNLGFQKSTPELAIQLLTKKKTWFKIPIVSSGVRPKDRAKKMMAPSSNTRFLLSQNFILSHP
jgi:hypothetical protein